MLIGLYFVLCAQPDILVLKCLVSRCHSILLIHERKKEKNQIGPRKTDRGEEREKIIQENFRNDMNHVWTELVHNVGRVGCSIGPS